MSAAPRPRIAISRAGKASRAAPIWCRRQWRLRRRSPATSSISAIGSRRTGKDLDRVAVRCFLPSVGAADQFVEILTSAGLILGHDERHPALIEQLEPVVPFHQF